jgi:phosphopantothenoylcysteine decarboxylase / phosphopantothenate---cysteine ligase
MRLFCPIITQRLSENVGVSGKLCLNFLSGVSYVGALSQQRILLGVSGGIAAYKAADLVRRLQDAGAQVRVVMTEGAKQFITPLTFQALSGYPVRDSLWDHEAEAAMGHIELARWATQILIAPASANTIARLANGRAEDLLSTLCLASDAPIRVAPAMNRLMWANESTQKNIQLLRERGVVILGPGSGDQACGEVGEGRLLEPLQIVQELIALRGELPLHQKRVLITAGPTFEDIDPVRFIGNRSSGKMGYALAQEAAAMGADVVLISGPVALADPESVRCIRVRSAAQMHDAVMQALNDVDVFIAAAAVADYTPAAVAAEKIKKTDDDLSIHLKRTIDILQAVSNSAQRPKCVVGFAAETQHIEQYARSKLDKKRLDFIAANDVSDHRIGFESEHNTVQWISAAQSRSFGPASKRDVARSILHDISLFLKKTP